MRIISGTKKGKKILLPDPNITRPLKDNVKENIFNVLMHSNNFKIKFNNIKVLDFFSGSGSFGLECISRGAMNVKFFETNPKTLNILYRNLSNNFDKKKFEIIKKDFFNVEKKQLVEKYQPNIIFLDPPYDINSFGKILKFINSLVNISNLIIIIHVERKKIISFENFKFIEERIYGLSKIFFLKTISQISSS